MTTPKKNSGGAAATAEQPAAQATGTDQATDQTQQTEQTQQQPPDPPAAAPPAPAPPAAKAAAPVLVIVGEGHGNTSAAARDLLLDVCDRFGVNPDNEARPKELLAWTFTPANELDDVPAAVTIVTQGGLKLKVFEDGTIDQESEERLAEKFNAYTFDAQKNRVRAPLPDDLTLPRATVTGLTEKQDHVYKGGYLKGGGRSEAARRQQAAAKRK